MRLWQAIRLFLRVLFDGGFAARLRELTSEAGAALATDPAAQETSTVQNSASAPSAPPGRGAAPQPVAARRSDAIALLALLQREARFVDIVNEPLQEYSDAQIGAAARDVLRDCRQVLQRVFALKRVVESEEGASEIVPAGYDPLRYRLTGDVSRQPPLEGRVVHLGWEATQCELPQWSGSPSASRVVAPVEVQIG